ncbi:MAG: DUF2721 domain-containing protein [Saonia sp.]
MENWYIPITIIPGIGLLILSTSNLLVALSNEIKKLIGENTGSKMLMERKLKQLKLLNRSMVFLYLSVACLLISGLVSGLVQSEDIRFNYAIYITILGITCALIGLISLISYSYRAVNIRQDQFHNKC